MKKIWIGVVILLMAGCAGQSITASEKARIAAYEMSQVYQGIHDQYLRLEKTLPESGQEELRKLAEPMNEAKRLLITYNDLLLLGLAEAEQTAKTKQKAQGLIADLVQKITAIVLKYAREE